MKPEQMVHMANQIAGFFAAYPREQAIDGIADHIRKFWEPRMRAQLFDYVEKGCAGLQELALASVKKLAPGR